MQTNTKGGKEEHNWSPESWSCILRENNPEFMSMRDGVASGGIRVGTDMTPILSGSGLMIVAQRPFHSPKHVK